MEKSSGGTEQNTFTIYDVSQGPVKGWSHIVSHPERFPGVSHSPQMYAVDERSVLIDEEAPHTSEFRTVLVRKLSDWNQQHANGIEPVFLDRPIKVGDIDSVSLRIKLNSEESAIPSREQLADHYGDYLSEDQIDGLDNGKACLGLSFMQAGYNDQGTETLNAIYYATFEHPSDFDRWMELKIPLEDFTFGYEKDYSLREVEREDVGEVEFIGFRINPEATGAKVARNYLSDTWDGSVPELYKEVGISLNRIEVHLSVD